MQHPRFRSTSCPRTARGIAMIEVLIAMLLISLWLLSSAGLQASSLKFQKAAESRVTAVTMAGELSERMEANATGARAGAYLLESTATATTAATNCTTSACTPAALADYDLAQWTERLTQRLILREADVAVATTAGLTTYTITIAWDEPRGRQTYANTSGSKTETMTFTTTKVIRNG